MLKFKFITMFFIKFILCIYSSMYTEKKYQKEKKTKKFSINFFNIIMLIYIYKYIIIIIIEKEKIKKDSYILHYVFISV